MSDPRPDTVWTLTLYIDGASFQSIRAVEALQQISTAERVGRVTVEVVDARFHPSSVRRDQVVALPTLIKSSPAPPCRLVGDLSDVLRLRSKLGLGGKGLSAEALPGTSGK